MNKGDANTDFAQIVFRSNNNDDTTEEYFDTLTERHTIQHIMGFHDSGLSNDTDLI